MGCASSSGNAKIHRSTFVEILSEGEANEGGRDTEVVKFRAEGKVVKVYFRIVKPNPIVVI